MNEERPVLSRRLPGRAPAQCRPSSSLLVLPCAPPVLSRRRSRTGGGLLVSLLLHGAFALLAYFLIVQVTERRAEETAGEEGTPGDEGSVAVVHRARPAEPRSRPPVPQILPDARPRVLASAPSAIALPQEAPQLAVALPAARPSEPVSASDTGGAPKPRVRSGSRGAGVKGRGRLARGNGFGFVAPTNPRLLTQTAPDYPASARRRGAYGVAWVRVQVNASGMVADASIYKSCGHSDLDEAAVRTAKRWRFAPATAGGQAVSAAAVVKVTFAMGS